MMHLVLEIDSSKTLCGALAFDEAGASIVTVIAHESTCAECSCRVVALMVQQYGNHLYNTGRASVEGNQLQMDIELKKAEYYAARIRDTLRVVFKPELLEETPVNWPDWNTFIKEAP